MLAATTTATTTKTIMVIHQLNTINAFFKQQRVLVSRRGSRTSASSTTTTTKWKNNFINFLSLLVMETHHDDRDVSRALISRWIRMLYSVKRHQNARNLLWLKQRSVVGYREGVMATNNKLRALFKKNLALLDVKINLYLMKMRYALHKFLVHYYSIPERLTTSTFPQMKAQRDNQSRELSAKLKRNREKLERLRRRSERGSYIFLFKTLGDFLALSHEFKKMSVAVDMPTIIFSGKKGGGGGGGGGGDGTTDNFKTRQQLFTFLMDKLAKWLPRRHNSQLDITPLMDALAHRNDVFLWLHELLFVLQSCRMDKNMLGKQNRVIELLQCTNFNSSDNFRVYALSEKNTQKKETLLKTSLLLISRPFFEFYGLCRERTDVQITYSSSGSGGGGGGGDGGDIIEISDDA